MWKRWALMTCRLSCISGIVISLSGCMTDACTGFRGINPSKKDVLSDGTARMILSHNEYGLALGCPGFKRPK